MDYYDKVPKDPQKNLRYRANVILAAQRDRNLAEELWIACSRDILFYINTFCWTYDPRVGSGKIPFITYDFQDDSLLEMADAMGNRDLVIKKSRDMGASWMLLSVFEWKWHFKPGQSFLLVSRNEDYVDKPGNPKSLFWKIDFLHQNQPGWLLPKMTRTKLRLTNESNGSTIDGESTTGDVARGDRRTAIGLDEFAAFDVDAGYRALASTRDATNSRIFNSTPAGSGNAFYDMAHKPDITQITLHWTQHPEKNYGLYKDEHGKTRSPWYDAECKRCAHPQEVAQELDIDFSGSDYQFFDTKMLDEIEREICKPPMVVGELEYDRDSLAPTGFSATPKGRLQLWRMPDDFGNIANDRRYVIGVDIATGTGSSNSVMSVADAMTGEKVAEFCCPNTRPEELGKYAVALGRYFRDGNGLNAYLIWEAPGPGRNFGDVVLENGYRNIYYREQENLVSKVQTKTPGWWPTKDSKRGLYGDYRRALQSKTFLNYSLPAIREAREIIFSVNGGVTHSRSVRNFDPSGARENHGDRPTADALCCRGIRKRKSTTTPINTTEVPFGSMLHRRRMAEDRKRDKKWW
jgi:hypothetical protein